MSTVQKALGASAVGILVTSIPFIGSSLGSATPSRLDAGQTQTSVGPVTVHPAARFDVSAPLWSLRAPSSTRETEPGDCEGAACGTSPGDPDHDADREEDPDAYAGARQAQQQKPDEIAPVPVITPEGAAAEQTAQGRRPPAPVLESFDGLGAGFSGPQGAGMFRNPSDSSLAVGPAHIFQIVNSRIAIYTKKGKRYDKTGTVIYGSVPTNNIFSGFGGVCDARDNGDAVRSEERRV